MTSLLQEQRFDPNNFEIRLLNGSEADTDVYRALRDNIRHGDGARNFADSYTREDELDEASWRQWCSIKREHCIVGAFDNGKAGKLASIMMITAQGPADSLVAEWEATWVEPEYRGSGVARRAYEEVQRITKELGYQHAIVFIREDNYHSRKIREAQGFIYMRTKENEHWADGSVANTNLFILDLHNGLPVNEGQFEYAADHLEKTYESLRGEVPFIGESIQNKIADLRTRRAQATLEAIATDEFVITDEQNKKRATG